MKYHGSYTVKDEFVINSPPALSWKITGSGEYVLGMSGGKTYFIKRNMHVRYPDKSAPKAVYEKYKAAADYVENKQAELRKRMSGLTCGGDRIAAEIENFWDDEKMFVTVTPHISGALPDDCDLSGIDAAKFISLALSAARSLARLHECGVIHGDIKEKNFVIVKTGGEYVPYLIDFDSSYPADGIPPWDSIGGTDGYQSPETIVYGLDENSAPPDTITTAADVFSLGITFHRWWTGAFPDIDMDRGTAGAAACLGKRITIDKKFDTPIGGNTEATLRSLINWMLAADPAARPTAEQVVKTLSDELEVREEFVCGGDAKPLKLELWDVHARAFKLFGKDNLKYKKGVREFQKINDGALKYRVKLADGSEKKLTVEQLCDAGYAERLSASLCEPWDEHADIFEFESPKTVSEKGYIKIERSQAPHKRSYVLYKSSGLSFEREYGYLETEGLIKKKKPKPVKLDADTPWPEHGAKYDREQMAASDVRSICKVEYAGEHRYRITYEKAGVKRVLDGVPANNVRLMGYIK